MFLDRPDFRAKTRSLLGAFVWLQLYSLSQAQREACSWLAHTTSWPANLDITRLCRCWVHHLLDILRFNSQSGPSERFWQRKMIGRQLYLRWFTSFGGYLNWPTPTMLIDRKLCVVSVCFELFTSYWASHLEQNFLEAFCSVSCALWAMIMKYLNSRARDFKGSLDEKSFRLWSAKANVIKIIFSPL